MRTALVWAAAQVALVVGGVVFGKADSVADWVILLALVMTSLAAILRICWMSGRAVTRWAQEIRDSAKHLDALPAFVEEQKRWVRRTDRRLEALEAHAGLQAEASEA